MSFRIVILPAADAGRHLPALLYDPRAYRRCLGAECGNSSLNIFFLLFLRLDFVSSVLSPQYPPLTPPPAAVLFSRSGRSGGGNGCEPEALLLLALSDLYDQVLCIAVHLFDRGTY